MSAFFRALILLARWIGVNIKYFAKFLRFPFASSSRGVLKGWMTRSSLKGLASRIASITSKGRGVAAQTPKMFRKFATKYGRTFRQTGHHIASMKSKVGPAMRATFNKIPGGKFVASKPFVRDVLAWLIAEGVFTGVEALVTSTGMSEEEARNFISHLIANEQSINDMFDDPVVLDDTMDLHTARVSRINSVIDDLSHIGYEDPLLLTGLFDTMSNSKVADVVIGKLVSALQNILTLRDATHGDGNTNLRRLSIIRSVMYDTVYSLPTVNDDKEEDMVAGAEGALACLAEHDANLLIDFGDELVGNFMNRADVAPIKDDEWHTAIAAFSGIGVGMPGTVLGGLDIDFDENDEVIILEELGQALLNSEYKNGIKSYLRDSELS